MSSNSQRSFKVYKIDNGTVIDHINSSMALKIIDILEIKKDGIVSIGMNFDSAVTGKKDIIKIENVHLDKKHTDMIAIFSPQATINIIKDSEDVEKRQVEVPKVINKVLRCPNPTCVTNKYHDCDSKFIVEHYDENQTYGRCYYCERETLITPDLVK